MHELVLTLALALYEIGIARFSREGFELKIHREKRAAGEEEPPLSPFFFKFDELNKHPEIIWLAVRVLKGLLKDEEFDVVAVISSGIASLVPELQKQFKVPVLFLQETCMWTPEGKLQGNFSSGERALVLGDLLTTSDSKIRSMRVLEESGLKITTTCVFLDREQGGIQGLEGRGVNAWCIFQTSDLLELYLEKSLIDDDIYRAVKEYLADEKNRFSPQS